MTRDPRVDPYIEELPDWQRRVCEEIRDLVHSADPEIEETIKRTVQPYFVLQGNLCALLAGHENKTARTIAFREGDPIEAGPLVAMIRENVANNGGAAGGN